MLNPAIKTLQTRLAAKSAEADGLIAQGKTETDPDKATEAATKAAAAVEEMEAIKSQIEVLQGATDLESRAAAVKTWDTAPVNGLPQAGASVDPTKSTKAGQTEIDLMTGQIVSEEGTGVLTGAQVKVIRNPEYLNAFKSYLQSRRGVEGIKSREAVKTLTEGMDTEGGFLVPAEMISRMIAREPTPTRIADLVQVITVSRDRAIMLKTNYETDDLYASAVRVYRTAEGAAATVANKPLFGTLTINVHSFTAELSVSLELLEDADFDVIGFLSEQFRIAYRNHRADKVINGSGIGEHFGILTRAGTAAGPTLVNSGSAAALTFDGLQALKFAVPEQYDQNARYVFNKRSAGLAIASLKDGDNRPLWPVQQQAGMVNGEPGSLFGYPYAYEAFMPDVAANSRSVIFGDFRGYILAMRLGMSIQVLREVEARQGTVVLLARFREGGDVAEPWRLKVQKTSA